MGRHLLFFIFKGYSFFYNISVKNEVHLMGILNISEMKKMDMKVHVECTCKYL